MALPKAPPKYASFKSMLAPIVRGDKGWRAYAAQCAVVASRDGDFGPLTEKAVKTYQKDHGLDVDGRIGPITSTTILSEAAMKADHHASLPDGVSLGFAVYEGGGVLAATNWDSPGGVDCGPCQRRIVGPPFSTPHMKVAFWPAAGLKWAAELLRSRIEEFHKRRPSLSEDEVLRVAVLAHNAPFLADQIVRHGVLSTPNATASWAPKPSGGFYTHAEWAVEYPRRILTYVGGDA